MSQLPPPDAPRRRPETGAQRLARQRRANAGYQRDLRARRAAAGCPDPDVLDRAIVDAIRDAIVRAPAGTRLQATVVPQDLVNAIGRALMARSARAVEAGRDSPVYSARAVADALQDRLLKPGKAGLTA